MSVTAIAALTPRRRGRVRGEVVAVTRVEHAPVCTEVVLEDGTGSVLLRFDGRRRLPGVEPGRSMVVEGTAAVAGGRCTMRNPAYEFLAGP